MRMWKIKADDLMFSKSQIIEAVSTWARFNGFSGEYCGDGCKATANVLFGGAGWFCPCGRWNVMSWSNTQMPHGEPKYGPTASTILSAISESKLSA